jgi:iron complex outermembrane receptor protein
VRIKSRSILAKALLSGVAPIICVANAHAQQVEEIIVTAQKRSENIQSVPITISAFSAEDLTKMGVSSTMSIGEITPGLQMSKQVGSATPYLRGIGTRASNNGVESPVATYVDGMYVGSLLGAVLELNNIERIEVLKGPQGTLFGRNATGGLIQVITKDPTQDMQARFTASYGSKGTWGGKAYISGGISENLTADLAISAQRMDKGFGKNITTGNRAYYDEYTTIRSKWVWTPTEDTTIKLIGTYAEVENDFGITRQCIQPGGCFGSSQLPNFHDTASNLDNGVKGKSKSVNLQVDHKMGSIDLRSITTYLTSKYDHAFDQDAGPVGGVDAFFINSYKTFSQEFQLKSDNDGAFNWIAGLFYWHNKVGTKIDIPQAGPFLVDNTLTTKSIAGFGEVNYAFSDKTKLTVGLRYTKDKRTLAGESMVPGFVSPYTQHKSFDKFTYRAVLDHHFTDSTMAYLSYNRGFRSGVFNTAIFFPAAPVGSETIDAYEAGVKGDYFDRKLRLNFSTFLYKYKDQIVQVPIPGGADLRNAASSKIWGLELEGQFVPTENLSFRFGGSYMHGRYQTHKSCASNLIAPDLFGPGLPGTTSGTLGDCSGNVTAQTPKFTGYLGAVYDIPTESGLFSINASAAYNNGFYWEEANQLFEDSYTIVNGEISFAPNDKLKLRVFGRNLLNTNYSVFTTAEAFGYIASAAPPRTWGVAVDVSF